MKNRKLSILISLFTLLIFSCVKEDENPEMPTVSYQLVVSAEEGGSVSSSGGTFNSGSEVTLTATPNSGYAFTSWSNGSTQNPITITVNSDQQLTANFEKSKYALTINIIGKGEVKEEIINSSKGTDYEGGTTVKLTPIPDSNWDFYWWNKAVSDNTLIKEITIDAPTTLDVTFDYASGKKMIGSWNLGPTNNASFLKKNSTADLYLIIDYALNFILVNSEDSTIDATELSTAAFGILDPTSPQEFEMIFGLLLGEDRSEDFSSEDFPIVNMTMSSSDFGTDANGSFDISMEFPSSNSSDLSSTLVDFSLSNTTLDVPLTENGLLSPTRDVSGTLLEQASLSLGVLEEFQKDVVDILGDDTLFPNICITEITSIELSSDNDNNSISCDENIKVTAAMGRAVLAPVELVMTDHDGNAQVIGMTPVTTSALSSIDLTTQTFSEWEVNLTRSGPLNWIDVSTDNAVTLTVSHTCYTGSEELTYDLLEACTETSSAAISYQVRSTDETSYVTQNEENYGKVYCGDVLKFDISLPTAHGGSVHLKLTYADGTDEIVSMGPVGSVPTADWSMNNVTLQEERYGNVTVAAVLDYTSTDEKTLESDLVLDYQEGDGCLSDALPYATLNYQVLKNGEWDDFKKFYVDQARQVEVDGIIYSDESVKFNATFDQAVEGDVKIRVDYRVNSNSTNIGVQYFDMQPVGGTTPNTEWELIYSQELLAEDFPNSDEIKNNAEELGISLSIGYDPETTQYIDRQVWESEDLPATLRLEYFLALSATVTYEIKGTDGNWITQTEENYGTVFCNDLVRYNIAFSRPLNGRETNNVDLLIYYNGGGNTIDVHDLSPIDTNDLSLWQSNEIKLEGEYGTAFWLVRLLNQYNRVINEDLGVDVFDFQQAETGCGDTAEISYQILELGTENYITQEGDAYGTVYCNDTLKFDVTLSRAHNGSVHLRAVYADGSESYISLAPAEELPTASWTLNNIKLSGAYGNVNFNAVVDYTSENEKVVETETLTISFNEAETGCD